VPVAADAGQQVQAGRAAVAVAIVTVEKAEDMMAVDFKF
jgi:hypothetical protein